MALEREDFAARLNERYAEQYAGLRQQLAAVDRNVMRFIAEGRERGEQIDKMIMSLANCASELTHIRHWQRVVIAAIIILGVGVVALLIKIF